MKFQHLMNSKIVIEAKPGAVLSNCIRECITQSIDFDTVIELIHNDKIFKIDPDKLVSSIRSQGLDAQGTVDAQLMDELAKDIRDIEEIKEDLDNE